MEIRFLALVVEVDKVEEVEIGVVKVVEVVEEEEELESLHTLSATYVPRISSQTCLTVSLSVNIGG